jgi:peptidoglycan biosynthesis protein MviN/MurJ (putative lipid II flippase)
LFSALYVACGLVGAAANGVMGTMIGAAIASWIGALVFWWQFRMALRHNSEPGKGLPSGPHRKSSAARVRDSAVS